MTTKHDWNTMKYTTEKWQKQQPEKLNGNNKTNYFIRMIDDYT